jgi:hypothetical protein
VARLLLLLLLAVLLRLLPLQEGWQCHWLLRCCCWPLAAWQAA